MKKKNNNSTVRSESPSDVIRNLAIRLPSFLIVAPEIAARPRSRQSSRGCALIDANCSEYYVSSRISILASNSLRLARSRADAVVRCHCSFRLFRGQQGRSPFARRDWNMMTFVNAGTCLQRSLRRKDSLRNEKQARHAVPTTLRAIFLSSFHRMLQLVNKTVHVVFPSSHICCKPMIYRGRSRDLAFIRSEFSRHDLRRISKRDIISRVVAPRCEAEESSGHC